MAILAAGRGEAIRQWVGRGGHLVVAVSGNWQAVNESLLGPMLPARTNGQAQVSPFDSLEAYTGGSHQVAFENTPASVAKMESRGSGRQGDCLDALTPLVVRGLTGSAG